ncbi:AAA family ATPase, partial [Candidatus Bathyarchaeota archaeon]|nr:AAA family ATPase [Candidatus Bathyarchaeota archaeon]
MIILLFGPAGAGKTTIARRLAGKLEGSQVISSDQFRRKVYRRLMREVRRRKGEGRYLIVDGTFYRRRWRE